MPENREPRPLTPAQPRDATLYRLRMPLVSPFRTSFGSVTDRDVLLLRLLDENGVEGWGECVAMHTPAYSSEYVAGADAVIERFLLPTLARAEGIDALDVRSLLGGVVGHRMAKATVESAVLDLQLRTAGLSFATYLGVQQDRVPVGVSIGIMDDVREVIAAVSAFVTQGYTRIKLKIQPGWDAEVVAAVRSSFGEALPMQVDANAAYDEAHLDQLQRLDEFGLLMIEQPFDEERLDLHRALAARAVTPICLDESITSAATAAQALDLEACRIINIKPGRVGGYLEAVDIHDLCLARQVPVWCGGMLETGVARVSNIALAALPGFVLPGDISGSRRYYAQDITEPVDVVDGHVLVRSEPGLGAVPDHGSMAEVLVEARSFALTAAASV